MFLVVVVVLREVDPGLLVLLNLLQDGLVLILHIKLCLIQLFNALFVVLECNLNFVLGLQAFIHDLSDFLNGHISLLLAEQCLLDFNL